jgi:hypothetical protein
LAPKYTKKKHTFSCLKRPPPPIVCFHPCVYVSLKVYDCLFVKVYHWRSMSTHLFVKFCVWKSMFVTLCLYVYLWKYVSMFVSLKTCVYLFL